MNNPIFNWEPLFTNAIDKIIANLDFKLKRIDYTKINLLLLNQIKIDYFESKTAIRFLVNVTKGKQGDYYLKPYDYKMIKSIYEALLKANTNWQISLQPQQIRIALPFLTTAKKAEFIKEYRQINEQSQIQLRQLRHQIQNQIKQHIVAKDLQHQALTKLQTSVNNQRKTIDEIVTKAIQQLSKV